MLSFSFKREEELVKGDENKSDETRRNTPNRDARGKRVCVGSLTSDLKIKNIAKKKK